jgi:hypothetical protein
MGRNYGFGSKSNGTDEEHADVSPMYADANDTNTRFYFTLERHPAGTTDVKDGDYVIVIPESIYDKPEVDRTMKTQDTNENGESQLYFTLEECSEQNNSDKEQSCQKIVPQENKDSTDDIYDTADEMRENGIQNGVSIEIKEQEEMSDDDIYVIPNDVNDKGNTIQKENEDNNEQVHVVNIPNDRDDSQKVSSKNEDHECSKQMGIDNDAEYSGQLEVEDENVDVDTQKRKNSSTEEDKFEQDCEKIYQNVNACLYPDNKGDVPRKVLPAERSTHVKIGNNSEEATANSQMNLGYLDEEILTQNKIKENTVNNENPHVIQKETMANDSNECLNENTTKNDNQCYVDDDIYEDWEDNIICRVNTVSGESGDDLNDSGNEPGDDIYQHDQESFYENLRHLRPSLVMQNIR